MAHLPTVAIAISCACLITYHAGDMSLANFSLLKSSILSCLIFLPLNLIWTVFLYPLYFSHLLRHGIPQAPPRQNWQQIFKPVNPNDLLEWMDTVPNDGLIRYLDIFNRESVCMTSTKAMTEVFQSNYSHYIKRPKVNRILIEIIGDGLLSASGAEHKRQRKILSPAFNFRVIKNLYPLLWTKASEMVTLMKRDIEANSSSTSEASAKIMMDDWAARVSLDIIGQAGFGKDFDALSSPETPVNTSYRTAFLPNKSSRSFFVLSLMTHPAFVRRLPLAANRKIQGGLNTVNAFIGGLITKRLSEDDSEKVAHKDIIATAMKTGAFTVQQLIDQAKTLLAAGHETSATAVTWALLSLSRHPEVQSRLRKEVRANLPSPESGIEVTSEMLDRLPYLNAVSKETMRVYAPVPTIGRIAAQDTELCGVRIKKGTQIMAFPWAMNRCKKMWGEDAREFRPERWLEGENHQTGGADPMAYLTFGTGHRMCIGKGFAQAENKALLAALIGTFEFKPVKELEDIKVAYGITARVLGGLEVQATVVDGW